MMILSVSIEESDFFKLGIKDKRISFADLKERISIEYARSALAKCHEIAKESSLSNMTMDEIKVEIQAARNKCK